MIADRKQHLESTLVSVHDLLCGLTSMNLHIQFFDHRSKQLAAALIELLIH